MITASSDVTEMARTFWGGSLGTGKRRAEVSDGGATLLLLLNYVSYIAVETGLFRPFPQLRRELKR